METSLGIRARALREQEKVGGAHNASTSGCQCEPCPCSCHRHRFVTPQCSSWWPMSCGRSRQGLCPWAPSSPGITYVSLLEHSDSRAVCTLQKEHSTGSATAHEDPKHTTGCKTAHNDCTHPGVTWAGAGLSRGTLPKQPQGVGLETPPCSPHGAANRRKRREQNTPAPSCSCSAAAIPAGKHFSPPLMHQLHGKSLFFFGKQ